MTHEMSRGSSKRNKELELQELRAALNHHTESRVMVLSSGEILEKVRKRCGISPADDKAFRKDCVLAENMTMVGGQDPIYAALRYARLTDTHYPLTLPVARWVFLETLARNDMVIPHDPVPERQARVDELKRKMDVLLERYLAGKLRDEGFVAICREYFEEMVQCYREQSGH